MSDRSKWLYLAAGLVVGAAGTLAVLGFPGGAGALRGRFELRYEEGRGYAVERVVDGDTIVIEGGTHLRYSGIDTPELGRFDYSSPDPFSREATEANRRLVEGRRVRLLFGPEKLDRYGRLLASVQVQDGPGGPWLNVCERLVREGLAKRLHGMGTPPDEGVLIRAEQAARAEKLGLWGAAREPRGPDKAPR
jgi:micrococcal nuclease